jgi:hypothetical protein
MTIGTWLTANNLPYPHPNSPFNDNPSHVERANDRGIIGYQVEYQMALAIEAILAANANEPDATRVLIMAPARHGQQRQRWLVAGTDGLRNRWL